jgi:hypothetical protein
MGSHAASLTVRIRPYTLQKRSGRMRFRLTGVTLLSTILVLFLSATPAALHADELLFVFATIGDSHIRLADDDDDRYMKAISISRELLSNYVNDINNHEPPVDFVVHLGDATDRGLEGEFESLVGIMNGLGPPLCAVAGNHDNFESDNKERWKQFAGTDTTNYAFDYYGIHFIVIDCTTQPYKKPLVYCDHNLRAWVREDLAQNRDKPTVILSHYNMWKRDWNAHFDTTRSYAEYRGMKYLRQVLRNAGNVVAVVNGCTSCPATASSFRTRSNRCNRGRK